MRFIECRGEGGFVGHWSLCTHFIQLFAPYIFKEYAITLNTMGYVNRINMDNLPKKMKKSYNETTDGLRVHAGSRHPYEYRKNVPFKRYMREGLWNPLLKWGQDFTLADVTWEPSRGLNTYSKHFILQRLDHFYDIMHPLIQNNEWFKKNWRPSEIRRFLQARPQRQVMKLDDTLCTLVITVFDREKYLRERLDFYHTHPNFKSIVVVWNNVDKTPPTLDASQYLIPIYILKQAENSLNNRFRPRRQIDTECVVNMDDDWNVSCAFKFIDIDAA